MQSASVFAPKLICCHPWSLLNQHTMRRCGGLMTRPLTHHIQEAAALLQAAPVAGAAAAASTPVDCASSSSAEHAARLESSLHCSTSTHTQGFWSQAQHQQVRGYAKKAGGGGKAAAKPAVAAAAAGTPADPLAPPEFRLKHVPRVYKGDPVAKLTGPQKALLEELTPSRGPLRSLRQLNWDLGPEGTLALMHEQLSEVSGVNTQVVPIFTEDSFQSAAGLAAMVQNFVEEGKGMPRVEQAMLTAIASMPDVPFEGIKIQLKGRFSGKGGKASKKVWVWGRTGRNTVDDPVDYAHEAVVTRAGYIGIKVWVKYKRSHMPPQHYRIAKSAVSVSDLLAMPPITALPSRSSSAWWNRPVTWQPQQHKAWDCFRQGYDPLTRAWERQQQQLEQPAQPVLAAAAAGEADMPHTS